MNITTTTTPPGAPPGGKKRRSRGFRIIRAIVIGAVGTILGITVISVIASAGSPAVKPLPTHSAAPAPAAPSAPEPSAPAQPAEQATKVTFVIKGNVPASEFGTVDITYGSNSDTHNVTLPSLAGEVTYSVPFDKNAQYYSADATFSGQGQATVKIVVSGTSMNPTTVAKGSASATDNGTGMASGLASAQAAPNDSTGVSWMQE
jgi:hypothetical protein